MHEKTASTLEKFGHLEVRASNEFACEQKVAGLNPSEGKKKDDKIHFLLKQRPRSRFQTKPWRNRLYSEKPDRRRGKVQWDGRSSQISRSDGRDPPRPPDPDLTTTWRHTRWRRTDSPLHYLVDFRFWLIKQTCGSSADVYNAHRLDVEICCCFFFQAEAP